MTHPQHKPTEPARPVSEAERMDCVRRLQSIEMSKATWWASEAPELLIEAFGEQLTRNAAEQLVQAMLDRDWPEVGARFGAIVYPYLDEQCIKAHDPEA